MPSSADSGVHQVEFVVDGAGGAVGHEADAADDAEDAEPAPGCEVLMQPKAAEQRHDDVAEGRGGHQVGEVGPAERGEVAGEERNEQQDAADDPEVLHGDKEQAEVVKVDLPDLGHAMGEEGVADGGRQHDGGEDGVLRGFEAVLFREKIQRDSDLGRCGHRSCAPCTFKGVLVDLAGAKLRIGSNDLHGRHLLFSKMG